MPRSGRTVLLLTAAAVAIAGCSSIERGPAHQTGSKSIAGRHETSSPPQPTEGLVTANDLPAHSLTISDLPAGWVVDNSPDDSSDSMTGCTSQPDALGTLPKKDTYSAGFVQGEGLPALGEDLAIAPADKTKSLFDTAVAHLSACKHLDILSDGVHITATLGQMSYPHTGEASAAFTAKLTASSTDFNLDFVLIRKGNLLCLITLLDFAPIDINEIEPLVALAASKL